MGRQGINVDDLDQIVALKNTIRKYEGILTDLEHEMRQEVLAAEEWFRGPNYDRLLENWEESLRGIKGFIDEAPSYTRYLQRLEDLIVDLLNTRL